MKLSLSLAFLSATAVSLTSAFTFVPPSTTTTTTLLPRTAATTTTTTTVPLIQEKFTTTTLYAGGFEWEDPEEAFDQGVDNPFKKESLGEDEDGMKIDAARLLGPRLQGCNLYFIGMMGSGKTAVGDIVARREYTCI